MKVSIKNTILFNTIAEIKALTIINLQPQQMVYCLENNQGYMFFGNADNSDAIPVGDIVPNEVDLEDINPVNGRWFNDTAAVEASQFITVEDTYTFPGDESDITASVPSDLVPDEIDVIIEQYNIRQSDGCLYYKQIQAEFVRDVRAEIITEADAFDIESQLNASFSKLQSGDWKTAYFLLDNHIISGSLTQTRYDAILLYIGIYIVNNY